MAAPLIAPSILSADFSALKEALAGIEAAGGDWIHLDVMDGSFVPEITFGSKMVADLRPHSKLPFDVHLMVQSPERHIEAFAAAGADYLTIHVEATTHVHRVLSEIRSHGARPGVSIIPSTPVARIVPLLGAVDLVLVMTVNPGYGGQTLIEDTLTKVSRIAALRARRGDGFLIEVDGGINDETAARAVGAGSDVLVTGSSFFSSESPKRYVSRLRG